MGGFRDEAFDASHSTVHHVDGDFTDSLASELLTELLHADPLAGDLVGQDGFQVLRRNSETINYRASPEMSEFSSFASNNVQSEIAHREELYIPECMERWSG